MHIRFIVRRLRLSTYHNVPHLTSIAMANSAKENRSPLFETGMSTGEGIPVIDMANLRSNGHGRAEVVKEIGRACEEWGFFHVVNHGVEEMIIENMWEAYRGLISYSKELPPEDNRKLQLEFCIFPQEMRELLMTNKEAAAKFKSMAPNRISLHFRGLDPDDGESSPALQYAPPSFRTPACEFYKALRNVGFELLEAISESLGMPSDTIYTITGRNGAIETAIHYYDPCLSTSTPCLMPHKDSDILTVLLPGPQVGGLQVLKEEHWITVEPMQGSLVINVGEVVEVITNGKYKSVFHRVMKNAEKARSSIGCFVVPTEHAIIEPLAEFIDEQHPPQYPRQTTPDLLAKTFVSVIDSLKSTNINN